jgi:hypothetical protein
MASENPDMVLKKESKSLVFKTIANLKNHLKIAGSGITLRELRKSIDANLVSNEEIGLAVKQL